MNKMRYATDDEVSDAFDAGRIEESILEALCELDESSEDALRIRRAISLMLDGDSKGENIHYEEALVAHDYLAAEEAEAHRRILSIDERVEALKEEGKISDRELRRFKKCGQGDKDTPEQNAAYSKVMALLLEATNEEAEDAKRSRRIESSIRWRFLGMTKDEIDEALRPEDISKKLKLRMLGFSEDMADHFSHLDDKDKLSPEEKVDYETYFHLKRALEGRHVEDIIILKDFGIERLLDSLHNN